MDLPPKGANKSIKATPKVSPDRARVLLSLEGARFSFSGTSKLPSNLFVRQDFYGADKSQASILNRTTVTQVYGLCTQLPTFQAHYGSATALLAPPALPPVTAATTGPQLTSTDLVTAVSEAQRLACNLKDACFSHSPRSSHSQDRDTLLLSIEGKNAEEIAAMRLERDIERKIKDLVRDRDVQTLVTASGGGGGFGGLGYGGNGVGNGRVNVHSGSSRFGVNDGVSWDSRAHLEIEREERALREREREQERERGRKRESERRLSGARGAGGDAQMQFNLFQDFSSGGRGDRGGGGFVDGIRDGWERRRSSVASTLDRGARRLAETMARMEAEVDFMRRRERERDRDRRRRLF
jgi:hypothetical protein